MDTRIRVNDKTFTPLFWLGLLFSAIFWLVVDHPIKALAIFSSFFPIVVLPLALLERYLRNRPRSRIKNILYPISHAVFLVMDKFKLLVFGFVIGWVVFGFTFYVGHAIYQSRYQHVRHIH